MCCGPSHKGSDCTCNVQRRRGFLTKEEETESLEDYKKELEKEIKGVERKIHELK